MIPITVGFIGGTAKRSWRSGWVLSSFYVLGMAAVYTTLGMVASLSGRIFGTLTNTSGWYLTLGSIMIVASLWMLEVIKFDPNVWWDTYRRKKNHHKKGILPIENRDDEENTVLSAFLLGASSGFIAAPCTTPVLTTILSYIAAQRSVGYGSLLMFSFSMGLGTILVAVGTFAGLLKILPRSGRWLSAVKITSGILILMMGQYYVYKAGAVSVK